MKKSMLSLAILLLFHAILIAQSAIPVNGKVTNSSNLALRGVNVMIVGDSIGTSTDIDGCYSLEVPDTNSILEFSYVGFKNQQIKVSSQIVIDVVLMEGSILEEVVITAYKAPLIKTDIACSSTTVSAENTKNLPSKNVAAVAATMSGISDMETEAISVKGPRSEASTYFIDGIRELNPGFQGETYELGDENDFITTFSESLSTFAVDVDRASYSNVRRYIAMGQIPPENAIRIEEMVNYFEYDYPEPGDEHPFRINQQLTKCPWNENHQVLHIGINTKNIQKDKLAPSNLVFLIDVSGSMDNYNKLPLVISSLKMLLNQLRPDDKITIVTYAGAAGCALPTTKVSEKEKILNVLENLHAGGSTAGGQGIQLAYKLAKESFIKGGNNRVILATDGDFNVGINSPDGLEKLIAAKRKENIFLTVLGFGMGNYRGDMVQRLADKGNGNHAYIDNIHEANKILVKEFTGSMYALAKDVKIQVEFNPAFIQAYRLIGYENRMLAKEDFNDDKKDGGEVGVGHSITALYELIPTGVDSEFAPKIDDLVFQDGNKPTISKDQTNIALIKLRYKSIEAEKSTRMQQFIPAESIDLKKASPDTRFVLAVAEFGMILKNSAYINVRDYNQVIELAQAKILKKPTIETLEFIKLVESSKAIDDRLALK